MVSSTPNPGDGHALDRRPLHGLSVDFAGHCRDGRPFYTASPWWLCAAVPLALLAALGVYDLIQTRHAIRRNYPVLGNLRFLFEFIRPEIRQYFLEDDTQAAPFSRAQRSIVYQRAKREIDKRPFGTQEDVYGDRYEWINHSMSPSHIEDTDFRVTVGGPDCKQPYSMSAFNVSAMSFGALSANAILALNEGARQGDFAHDTGEGGISRYHRQPGGGLVWNIGSGYFGCRDEHGAFSEEAFVKNACTPQVKMIEIKLSQGAKPGHGGILPAGKVTPEIAEARGVAPWQDCNSPATHSAFDTPIGLMKFVARLRELSGGKPVGFKFCVGHPGNGSPSSRPCSKPASRRTSSWWTAPRAARARPRSSSSTTSARRCAKRCAWSTTR